MMDSQSPHLSNQQDPLTQPYTKPLFVETVNQLALQLKINSYYSYDDIYDEIFQRKGKVTGADLLETMEKIKQKEQSEEMIKKEVKEYKQKIQELKLRDIHHLKKSDFLNEFGHFQTHEAYISPIINEKIADTGYISVNKFENLINSLEQIVQENKSFENLYSIPLEKSSVYFQSSFDFGSLVKNMQIFIKEHVKDPFTIEKLDEYIEQLKNKEKEISSEFKSNEGVAEEMRKYIEKREEELMEAQRSIEELTDLIQKMRQKNQKIVEKIHQKEKKEKQLIQNLEKQQIQNDRINHQHSILNTKFKTSEEELNYFRTNYRELAEEYDKMAEKVRQTEERQEVEKEERLFTQRGIKEQLEEAYEKINRLRQQNGQLRQKLSEVESKYEARIQQLQLDLQEAALRRARDSSMGMLHMDSRESIRASFFPGSKVNLETGQSRQRMGRQSSVFLQKQIKSHLSQAFKKKQAKISNKVSQILIDQSDQKINIHDEMGLLQQKQQSVLLPYIGKAEEEKKPIFFSTTGYLIHESNDKFPIGIIITSDKIVLLDSKSRPKFQMKFEEIGKIFICYHNLSWMVLKVKKNTKRKSVDLSDMVISIFNRDQLVEFLISEALPQLKENQVKVKVEKEENIWLKIQNKEFLLSNFKNFYNIYRISINNSYNMFEVSLEDNSLLSFSSKGFLIVNPIGILIFERDGYDLESLQKLLCLLPLVEKMEVVELRSSNEIKVIYQTNKKYYKIKAKSMALMKKMKRKIDAQREINLTLKVKQFQKYTNLFNDL